MSSYESINYTLRPAKHIERKMMIEVFRNLSNFDPIETYRYVGFGSVYFSDFYLVHKVLGLTDMISVEKDVDNQKRFRFNSPYRCIDIKFGISSDVLPQLDWLPRSIVWLDYDGTLDSTVLMDISFVCSQASVGSIFVITVNAEPERFPSGLTEAQIAEYSKKSIEILQQRIGEDKIPKDVSGKDLRQWGTAKLFRRIIHNQILSTLTDRNGALEVGNKLQYKQLFNFNYADGKRMVTVGGLLFDDSQQQIVDKCKFEERYKFVRSGEAPFLISAPNLTFRELRYLDKFLPGSDSPDLSELGIPSSVWDQYAEIYRYFPTFAETDI